MDLRELLDQIAPARTQMPALGAPEWGPMLKPRTKLIDRSELKPGDLVFFNTMKRAFSHVGIYLGDSKFIHAPQTGKAVKVDGMRSAYWQKRFNGARRVPLANETNKP